MRKLVSILLFISPVIAMAQTSLQKARTSSWYTLVYRLPATEAKKYIEEDSIPVQRWLDTPEYSKVLSADFFEDSLAVGTWLFISTQGGSVKAEIFNKSNLVAIPVNNKNKQQIDVRDKDGKPVTATAVYINGKPARYYRSSNTFYRPYAKKDDISVTIFAEGDTLFTTLTSKDEQNTSISRQRWINFKRTKLYRTITWVPWKIKRLVHRLKTGNPLPAKRIGAKGYVIFNQPKYKPLDTVRYKMYAVGKSRKPLARKVNVVLGYSARGKYHRQLLATSKPVTPGAYTGEFVLADSVPTDIFCSLLFETIDSKPILGNNFKVEEYVLDEIGKQEFRSVKDVYFSKDSLTFFASAKDANGLNVLDASAQLVLLTSDVKKFYRDTLFVPDTLYTDQKKLLTNGETKFSLPATHLPPADLAITAKLIFKNSNNELQEKQLAINYRYKGHEIFVRKLNDSLHVVYMENGEEKIRAGEMEMNEENPVPITFPYSFKINPLAESYTFYAEEEREYYQVTDRYTVTLSRISRGDTLGFTLDNPYRIPVYFTVLDGNYVVGTGSSTDELIAWNRVMSNKRKAYTIRWQYYWGGEEQMRQESIGLLYKLLKISVDASPKVFPGQADSLHIKVADYKGRPAPNVNLTAASYNNQFSNTSVQNPPYLARYKSKKFLMYDGYFLDDPDEYVHENTYPIGRHKSLLRKLGLDTMWYYQILFPPTPFHDAISPIQNFAPQVSVNVVENGVPQEIYLLYLNKELVYYHGVTDNFKNAFAVYPENVQLTIRLRDKLIYIDSVYLQPFYKHDLSFDLDHLPPHTTIEKAKAEWSIQERNLLERSIWRMNGKNQANDDFVWQGNKVFRLGQTSQHRIGPFTANQHIHFFRKDQFDQEFVFEPGYVYDVSKNIIRLEKIPLFAAGAKKYPLQSRGALLKLGDTIAAPPAIVYPKKISRPVISLSRNEYIYRYANKIPGRGSLFFTQPKDSVILYSILLQKDSAAIITSINTGRIYNLRPGKYQMMLVTRNYATMLSPEIAIVPDGTFCLNLQDAIFSMNDARLDSLSRVPVELPNTNIRGNNTPITTETQIADSVIYLLGGATVSGVVLDKKGKSPIVGSIVRIKNARSAVATDAQGNFAISNIRPGRYVLQISSLGYKPEEVEVALYKDQPTQVQVMLEMSENALQEVVVVGYGISKKSNLTGSVAAVSGDKLFLSDKLAGKVAGISSKNGYARLQVRGISSLANNNNPIYVVDGIVYDSPPKIDENLIQDISVLTATEGVALYGSRAADGVIVITTKTKTDRTAFRDYAFWVPNFFTDKSGNASVAINYPDNVTGWKTFVVAMDKKLRIGKETFFTQAYKPMTAQLNLPLFLIEGDSAECITKVMNYTPDPYNIHSVFSVNGTDLSSKEEVLPAAEALISNERVVAPSMDTLSARFSMRSTTGFNDAETRKIPVFKRGIEETTGQFWLLRGDTSFVFTKENAEAEVTIYAQNNTLDMLLEQLEKLRKYPYYCTEQITSKLIGLALEKKIRAQLGQRFTGQKEMDALLQKIQKAQLFEGGWAWWENGHPNFYISNYIAQALLQFRDNPLVETNIRNAFLYLHNRLPYLTKSEKIAALSTLSAGSHQMNYTEWMKDISFDSLSQHQQWQWVKIRQEQKLPYTRELAQLVEKKTETMLGGLHWGKDNYSWYSNSIATTVLAFQVLEKESAYADMLPKITQYFLAKRKTGYWANTVETASIIQTILPTVLNDNKKFLQPASIAVSGDSNFSIQNFPAEIKLRPGKASEISFAKSGGGLVYLTAYQKFFNNDPVPVTNNFEVSSRFEKNGVTVQDIKSGERIKMIVTIKLKADAEFVMASFPIPAGCIFSNKNNSDWRLHKEYNKEKLQLFIEFLGEGVHEYEVELEPRYNGTYTLNPAKAELMYFPVFYGRNAATPVTITPAE